MLELLFLYMAHKPVEDYLNLSPCIFTWYHMFSELTFDGENLRSVCVECFIFKINNWIVKLRDFYFFNN